MRNLKTFFKLAALFVIGGAAYVLIELLWRGHSHISMFILGGMCFVSIGLINELFPWELGIVWQALIGGVLVTTLEFITGLIVNVWLGLNVWDYSNLPLNLMGQICLPFFFAWVGLSVVAIILDDYFRYWFFGEEKPHYTWSKDAREWAIANGLIGGTGNNANGEPNYAWADQLTREQAAALFYRFAKLMGKA